MRSLRGVRVLEFAPHFPGQYLTQLLQSLGAQVTKVEGPEGDANRRIAPMLGPGLGFIFASSNQGKTIRRIDLKTPMGRRGAYRLVRGADILVQAYRPGTARRLGIDWPICRRLNPRLVYVEVSGWGPRGAWAERHGHDLAYQAAAGCLDPDAPRLPPTGLGDVLASFWGALAAVAALYEARSRGAGRRVPISIAGAALAGSQLLRAAALSPEGPPAFLRGKEPFYGLYRCRDDRWLALAVVEPEVKTRFLKAVHLGPSRSKVRLHSALERAFRRRGRADWLRRLRSADVPCGPVLSAQEAPEVLSQGAALLPPHQVMWAGRRGADRFRARRRA